MQILKSRNLAVFLCPFSSPYGNACFHSTPSSFAKWKNKWEADRGRGQEPSKNYVRYATRLKRTNAKKALRDLLSKSTSKFSFQDDDMSWSFDGWEQEEKKNSNGTNDGVPFKQSPDDSKTKNSSHQGRSSHQNRNMRRPRKRRSSSDYLEQDETIFQATFGSKCYTWSFRSWGGHQFQNSTWGFEWRENFDWGANRTIHDSETDEDDHETTSIGSSSDRKILGLPSTGPLKMEDVKSAFRTSALKWHPDKHQGPSQATAEEKFKLCVNAYKSLCSSLSSG
ncbi:uncharacterized protein LOC116247470 [Nymphaea colorata]|nr:uncharacterized protein LOC116247470 [Nymphaea colorata]